MKRIEFANTNDILTERPFDFARHSSIGCGGNAKYAFYPKNVQECVELLDELRRQKIAFSVVGNMTNVLPPDGETDTVIVCTKKLAEAQIGKTTFVEAGITSGRFLKACKYAGKSGAEFLEGIPCTLGGALFMNAGADGVYISEIVESVTVYREGKLISLSKDMCEYSYKNSIFMHNDDVILGASIRLISASKEEIERKSKHYSDRRAHLPKGKSMGCVFKNPTNEFAGALIEKAGLKGKKVGNAFVSEKHANFIINEGNATSEEIKTLIKIIKDTVFSSCGIKLEEEIRYLY